MRMTFSFFRAATLVGASMLLAKSVHAQIDLTTISNPDKASCVMHVIVCCSWYISPVMMLGSDGDRTVCWPCASGGVPGTTVWRSRMLLYQPQRVYRMPTKYEEHFTQYCTHFPFLS